MFGRLKKIKFVTDPDEWHGMSGELIWAKYTGDGRYILRNIPLYAYGISFGDVVTANKAGNGDLVFSDICRPGGHSTYRILLKSGVNGDSFMEIWPKLAELGCSYESSKDPEDVFSIDVPASSDIYPVHDILQSGVIKELWYLDEGNIEHDV